MMIEEMQQGIEKVIVKRMMREVRKMEDNGMEIVMVEKLDEMEI